MNFDLETFHKFDFTGSQITSHNVYAGQSEEPLSMFCLQGSFEKEQYESCKFWSLWFKQFENLSSVNITDLTGNRMSFLDICPEGEFYFVEIIVGTDSDAKEISFRCREIRPEYYRYKGMSYRNLYGTEEYQKIIDGQRYVLDEKYYVQKRRSFCLTDIP